MDKAENLFEITFAATNPFVAEILHFDDGDTGFAGQAFDEIGLTRAHRTTEQVTLRESGQIVFAPKLNVLTEPGFDGAGAERARKTERTHTSRFWKAGNDAPAYDVVPRRRVYRLFRACV